jgi:dihydrofolate synthase/folylpolyglutamate synthase
MSYASAVEHLYARGHELAAKPNDNAPRRKFDLDHMRRLAAALGDPQKKFRSVLIAGTNGKGSTAATLAHIVKASGKITGLYTSPHLVRVNERVQIGRDGSPFQTIDDDTFASLYFRVDDAANQLVAAGKLPHSPSFFEVMTAIAFLFFAESGVEVAILEVGLGGRLDATNIVDPIFSVITDIALDHMDWLGNTLTEIAGEKAGILRENGILITLPQHPEANAAIGQIAVSKGVNGINAADFMPERLISSTENHYQLQLRGKILEVNSPLAGEHQQRNLALAIASALQMEIPNAAIERGIRETVWPGRLQRVQWSGREVLMDVAHNPAGAWTLRSYLSKLPEGPKTLVFSSLADKAVREMAQILFPLFEGAGDRILLAPMQNPRAATLASLQETAQALETRVESFGSVREAMAAAVGSGEGLVVVAGSVFLVGEVQALRGDQNLDEVQA